MRPDSAPDFSAAYRDLLAGLANGLPRPELTGLLLSAAEALEAAGISVLKLDDETSKTIWFYGVRLGRDGVGELDATSTDALDLDARFSNLSSFEAHLAQVDMLIK